MFVNIDASCYKSVFRGEYLLSVSYSYAMRGVCRLPGLRMKAEVWWCWYVGRGRNHSENTFTLQCALYYLTRWNGHDAGKKLTKFISVTYVHRK